MVTMITMVTMGDPFISTIVERVCDVSGIQALVLGGSRGRPGLRRGTSGAYQPDSDYDIGLYFDSPETFDIAALNRVATELDDEHRENLCTPVGGWGPWVVGGGWLKINGQPVDFIYRELPRVRRTVDECLAGRITIGYQAGHPFGFTSAIYMAEVATCQPLWDPRDTIAELKSKTRPYPAALKQAILNMLSWEAGFCAALAEKFAKRGDDAYGAGVFFRAAMCMTQTLFAINEQWWLNEKGAVALASTFDYCPPRYAERVNEMFARITNDVQRAIAILKELNGEVCGLGVNG